MRPFISSRPASSASSGGGGVDAGNGSAPSLVLPAIPAPPTTDCPTVQPSDYIAIATQQLNTTPSVHPAAPSTPSTSAANLWTYGGGLLTLTVCLGLILLASNLIVIVCLCHYKKRRGALSASSASYQQNNDAAALKQLIVHAAGGGGGNCGGMTGSGGGVSGAASTPTGASRHSVNSVIDLTQMTHVCVDYESNYLMRSSQSLSDLQHVVTRDAAGERHERRGDWDFNARRSRMGHDRHVSLHEITV